MPNPHRRTRATKLLQRHLMTTLETGDHFRTRQSWLSDAATGAVLPLVGQFEYTPRCKIRAAPVDVSYCETKTCMQNDSPGERQTARQKNTQTCKQTYTLIAILRHSNGAGGEKLGESWTVVSGICSRTERHRQRDMQTDTLTAPPYRGAVMTRQQHLVTWLLPAFGSSYR